MSVRRNILDLVGAACAAALLFTLGTFTAREQADRQLAARDRRIAELRTEMDSIVKSIHDERASRAASVVPTTGISGLSTDSRAGLVEEIKTQLQDELGMVPVRLLRDRRRSFVELYAYDNKGHSNYGTAGYLGGGYFITVKHAVVALPNDPEEGRKITAIKLVFGAKSVSATLVDSGDAATEVDPGDWAVLKAQEPIDLPALKVNLDFAYDFADPIFRLGNDYSKGIILGTGYIGQRTPNGLVTCLTDGHPGVSGGGVLDQRGDMVGIPIGRMQGDYRFSFILPLRREMVRKVHRVQVAAPAAPAPAVAAASLERAQ
jgi:hypothetical protein